MQHCFMRPPAGRRTLGWGDDERAATAFIGGGIGRLGQRVEEAKGDVKAVAQTVSNVTSGKVKLTTIYQEGKQTVEDTARTGADLINDPEKRRATVEAVHDRVARLQKTIKVWMNESPEKQVDDVATAAGGGVVDLGINALLGGATKVAGEAAGLTNAARKGNRAEEVLTGATKVESKAAQKVHAAEVEAQRAAHAAKNQVEQAAYEGIGPARRSRVKHMEPDSHAHGEHTTFVRDPGTNRVHKYQEWDKNSMPVKRADVGSNSSNPSPHDHHPAGVDHMHTYQKPNETADGKLFPGKELKAARHLDLHEIPK